MKKYTNIILISAIVLFVDILSKGIISNIFILNDSIELIKNFFKLTYVHNYGAAWSIFNNQTIFLIIVTLLSLGLLIFMIKKENKLTKLNNWYYGLIIGGILGNLSNRIVLGYVIDFFDFNIFGYDFPIFNIADSAIVISIFLMILEIITKKGD